jgi:hypothetical protein
MLTVAAMVPARWELTIVPRSRRVSQRPVRLEAHAVGTQHTHTIERQQLT